MSQRIVYKHIGDTSSPNDHGGIVSLRVHWDKQNGTLSYSYSMCSPQDRWSKTGAHRRCTEKEPITIPFHTADENGKHFLQCAIDEYQLDIPLNHLWLTMRVIQHLLVETEERIPRWAKELLHGYLGSAASEVLDYDSVAEFLNYVPHLLISRVLSSTLGFDGGIDWSDEEDESADLSGILQA